MRQPLPRWLRHGYLVLLQPRLGLVEVQLRRPLLLVRQHLRPVGLQRHLMLAVWQRTLLVVAVAMQRVVAVQRHLLPALVQRHVALAVLQGNLALAVVQGHLVQAVVHQSPFKTRSAGMCFFHFDTSKRTSGAESLNWYTTV